jgi:hypothetical protein
VALALAMAFTVRPTGLASPCLCPYWTILEDGKTVGRIYEAVGKPPEYRLFWSMMLLVDWRSRDERERRELPRSRQIHLALFYDAKLDIGA